MSLSLAPPRRSISFIDSAVKVSVIMDGCRAQGCQIGSDFPAQSGNTSGISQGPTVRSWNRVARLGQISQPNLATQQVSSQGPTAVSWNSVARLGPISCPIWQHSRYQPGSYPAVLEQGCQIGSAARFARLGGEISPNLATLATLSDPQYLGASQQTTRNKRMSAVQQQSRTSRVVVLLLLLLFLLLLPLFILLILILLSPFFYFFISLSLTSAASLALWGGEDGV